MRVPADAPRQPSLITSHMTVMWTLYLITKQLHTPVDVSNENEVLYGHSLMDVCLSVNEGHPTQGLVVVAPQEYLGQGTFI